MSDEGQREALRVEHLVKSFGAVSALVDVSMYLLRGEVLGLIWDNGAGKSTLVKILTGYIRPDSGETYVNGEQVVMDGGEQLKGASEFSHLGDLLTEEQWQMMKPKKKS